MEAERGTAPGRGVYIPTELRLLRSVVQEALRINPAKIDKEDAEAIAREVMAAYRRGVMDREELLRIAQQAAKARAVEDYFDRVGGLFA